MVVAFNTSFATDSLAGMRAKSGVTNAFVGIVLLPLLRTDSSLLTAAMQDNTDLFISNTVGKCLQTALLVTPFTAVLGWIMRISMSLEFKGFEVAALFASVLYINSMIQDGESNW